MLGGRRLSESAISAQDPNHRVSDELLGWHLRMCILENMKGNAGPPSWEYDLGPDDMGEILDEMDGERMEAELSPWLNDSLDFCATPIAFSRLACSFGVSGENNLALIAKILGSRAHWEPTTAWIQVVLSTTEWMGCRVRIS